MWCPSTPTTLSSALLLSAPLRAAAWFGRSSEVCDFLAVLISIHYLSSPLSPSGDFPPLTRTALEGESKLFLLSRSLPSQWQADRMRCTLHLPDGFGPSSPPTTGMNCIDRVWWPSSLPAFSHSPWWQKKLSEHEAGKQPWKQVKQARPPELLPCLSLFAFGSRAGNLWIWGKLFQIWGFKYDYGFCSHLAAGSGEPQEERSLGVSSGLWSAAPPLRHSSNKLKPAIKAKLKWLK